MNKQNDSHESRFISRLTRKTLALIMAGGHGTRLHELTEWRCKPAVQFGGKFRIIDFPLSNCVNSDIRRIGILTQYKSHSLIRHLVRGWVNRNSNPNEFVEILPASQRVGGNWYLGTADAVYQNIDIIRDFDPSFVLVLGGDHVYKMDYGLMLAAHVEKEADMTVACLEVPLEEAANDLGVMTVDENYRVIAFNEKPAEPTPIPGKPGICLASMGNYVFNTPFLFEQLFKDADDPQSAHDFGRNIIPSIVDNYRVFAYPFRDERTNQSAYWRDVGTLDAFWDANIELTKMNPELNLYEQRWPIHTDQAQAPPAKFVHDDDDRRGTAVDSMVSGGCIVSGSRVARSLLFSNCHVHSFSELRDSVVLPNVEIGQGCKITRAILDRGCVVPNDTVIGEDPEADQARGFRITPKGVVLVTPAMLGQRIHHLR